MTTIELTPDLVFERADGVASPIPKYWGPSSTLRPKSKPKPHSRGYHSTGSATLPTRGRKGGAAGSEYGIMISVKDIKGHPFVVLEDKDKQKHMVQAPENEGNSSVLSSEGRNGFSPDVDDNTSPSDLHYNSLTQHEYKRQPDQSPVPRLRSRESIRRSAETQNIPPSHAKVRSKSVPPGRAGQGRRQQRARSVSPPARERSIKPVDSENIKPVRGLIGFFEATSPTQETKPFPTTKNTVTRPTPSSKIRDVANQVNANRVVSPTSTVSISSINSSVDVSQNMRRSGLTVTTVDDPPNASNKPEGRYFALTSPGVTKSNGGTFTMPRLTKIEKPVDYTPKKANLNRLPRSSSTEPYEPKSRDPRPFTKSPGPQPYHKPQEVKPPNRSSTEEGADLDSPKFWEDRKKPSYLPSYQRNLQAGDSFPRKKQEDQPSNVPKTPLKESSPARKYSSSPKKTDSKETAVKKSTEESPNSTHVSKAKFIGPSQMLLNKTRRRKSGRTARKLSTATSDSEYSGSEFSDAESLKLGEDAYHDKDDTDTADNEVLSISRSAPLSTTPEPNDELIKQLGHRRTPSIKFEKIASEDVTKTAPNDVVDSSALNEERTRADRLEKDLKNANDKIEKLNEKISVLESKLRSANCDIDIKQAENGLLKHEVSRLKKNLEEALSSDEDEKQSVLSLQRSLSTAKRDKSSLEETITLLESQKSTLKSQLQDARREREDNESQIRSLKHNIEKYQSKINEHERNTENARKELSRAKRQSEAQVRDLESQLEKVEDKSRELQVENSALEKQLYELKHQQMANADEDEHINETVRQLEQSKLKALQDLEAAFKEIDEKSRSLREAERKNNNLQEELRRMDVEMEAELKEREATVLESRQSTQQLKEMKAQEQVANREIEMLKKELDNVKSKGMAANSEMTGLQDLMDEKDSKIESLGRKNKALQKDVEDLKSSVGEQDLLSAENMKLSADVVNLKKQLRETEIELMATKDALDDAQNELKKISDKAEQERQKATELDRDTYELRDDYERTKSALEQKEAALNAARAAIGKIENQMKDYEESHSQSEKEKHLIEADRDETRKEMEALQERVESQSKQIDDANKTVKELRAKLADDVKSGLDGIERISELKKEVQRLQSMADEKSQQIFAAEETIYRQKEVIEDMNAIHENAKKAALEEMEKFMTGTESQFGELRTELEKKNGVIARLEAEKRDLEEELDELERRNPQFEDDHEKEEELVNLSQKLRDEEEEKRILLSGMKTAQDKLGNALNEIEIERSRAQLLLDEKRKCEDDAEYLRERVRDLEERLDQEAVELNNIKAHHVKTERKLRDVLKQAQDENDRAVHERELLAVRAEASERRADEAEAAVARAEDGRLDLENELRRQTEANYKLQQTLAALGIGHSPGGSDSPDGLLTSV